MSSFWFRPQVFVQENSSKRLKEWLDYKLSKDSGSHPLETLPVESVKSKKLQKFRLDREGPTKTLLKKLCDESPGPFVSISSFPSVMESFASLTTEASSSFHLAKEVEVPSVSDLDLSYLDSECNSLCFSDVLSTCSEPAEPAEYSRL